MCSGGAGQARQSNRALSGSVAAWPSNPCTSARGRGGIARAFSWMSATHFLGSDSDCVSSNEICEATAQRQELFKTVEIETVHARAQLGGNLHPEGKSGMEVTQIERALTIVPLFAIVQTRGLLRVKPYTRVSSRLGMLRNIDLIELFCDFTPHFLLFFFRRAFVQSRLLQVGSTELCFARRAPS